MQGQISRGRFAPSPTGLLHLGSLAAALASFLVVKQRGGAWLVRVEDLDPPREMAGMVEQQLKSLAGFGLVSDEPVIFQSQRSNYYDAALNTLIDRGKAFYCSCSRAQLAGQQGIHRHCIANNTRCIPSIRLKVDDCLISFTDRTVGLQRQNIGPDVGDFVLKRADGLYAYQLAVVVDDAAQSITQIVRGADLLDSTPRQIFLQQQLGYSEPEYAHIALVLDAAGNKLSKSQWSSSIDDEDRFNIFAMAYQHLGQDQRVLSRQQNMAQNLSRALESFQFERMKAPTAHGQPETPDVR